MCSRRAGLAAVAGVRYGRTMGTAANKRNRALSPETTSAPGLSAPPNLTSAAARRSDFKASIP